MHRRLEVVHYKAVQALQQRPGSQLQMMQLSCNCATSHNAHALLNISACRALLQLQGVLRPPSCSPTWARCSHCRACGVGLSGRASRPRLSSSAHRRASASGCVASRNKVQQMVWAVVCRGHNTTHPRLQVVGSEERSQAAARLWKVETEVERQH